MNNIAGIFETLMLVCFGISWPISVVKSIKSKSIEGKSVIFTIAIIVGYICGLTAKFINHGALYLIIVYILNLCFVLTDLVLYGINYNKTRGGVISYKQAAAHQGQEVGKITPEGLTICTGDHITLTFYTQDTYHYNIAVVWKYNKPYMLYRKCTKNNQNISQYTLEKSFKTFQRELDDADKYSVPYLITIKHKGEEKKYINFIEDSSFYAE